MTDDIDIPITLRAGVEWDNGRIRYRVVSHVYGEKPRLKLIGPSVSLVCPECRRAFRSSHAMHVHFGSRHRGAAWPWRTPWLDNVRPQKARRAA